MRGTQQCTFIFSSDLRVFVLEIYQSRHLIWNLKRASYGNNNNNNLRQIIDPSEVFSFLVKSHFINFLASTQSSYSRLYLHWLHSLKLFLNISNYEQNQTYKGLTFPCSWGPSLSNAVLIKSSTPVTERFHFKASPRVSRIFLGLTRYEMARSWRIISTSTFAFFSCMIHLGKQIVMSSSLIFQ